MQPSKINCFIFTALQCEAKTFITQFKLKKDLKTHPFTLYYNEQIVLAITGSGKIAMAAAVAYTLAIHESTQHPALINIGIAGHQTASIGELFFAHKITDADNGKNFYPQLIIKNDCLSQTVCTVSKPETNYQNDCLYDMEASGFYEIASRFTTAELIQVFKVVSDNQTSGVEFINAKKVTQWITDQSEKIIKTIENLQQLAITLENPNLRYESELLQRYHFTVSSQHQLKTLLHRWDVLTDYAELDFSTKEFNNGKAIVQWLQQKIEEQTFKL